MDMAIVGVRELQQHASRLVHDVEQGRAEYRVTVQGRDTGVALTQVGEIDVARVVTAADLIASPLWRHPIPEDIRQKMLDAIETGREAMGYVGDGQASL